MLSRELYRFVQTRNITFKKYSQRIKNDMSNSCIWSYFVRGKTHDLYGLLAMIVLNFILLFMTHDRSYEIIAVLDLMISSAIFADLWAHCFHH